MEAPVYQTFYIVDDENGLIEVKFAQAEDAITKLRVVENLSQVTNDTQVYVKVEHPLEYPCARYDFEATSFDARYQDAPDKYCAAAVVATPKMALM